MSKVDVDQAISNAYGSDSGSNVGDDERYMDMSTNSIIQEVLNSSPDSDTDSSPESGVEPSAESSSHNQTDEVSEPSQPDDSSVEDASSDEKQAIQNQDYVVVKGADGRKRKIKVDYSNRDAIKQAFLKAHGMQQFRQERDNLKSQLDEIQKEYGSQKELFDKMKEAFQKDHYRGLVRTFGVSKEEAEDMWAQAVDAELERREYLASLSPDEKLRMELQEKQEAISKEAERYKAELEDLRTKSQAEQEEVQVKALQTKLDTSFNRYAFSGKLSSPRMEQTLDKDLFDTVYEQLKALPEETELTQGLVDKLFRTEAAKLQREFNLKVDQGVKKAVSRKSNEAGQKLSVAAKKGLQGNAREAELEKLLEDGDMSSYIRQSLFK